MSSLPSRHPAFAWLRLALALLALVAQVGIATAPLGEGRRGEGMGPHVEHAGDFGHYAHDEALCAACQVRTIHGAVAFAYVAPLPLAQPQPVVAVADLAAPAAPHHPDNPSRAPPCLI